MDPDTSSPAPNQAPRFTSDNLEQVGPTQKSLVETEHAHQVVIRDFGNLRFDIIEHATDNGVENDSLRTLIKLLGRAEQGTWRKSDSLECSLLVKDLEAIVGVSRSGLVYIRNRLYELGYLADKPEKKKGANKVPVRFRIKLPGQPDAPKILDEMLGVESAAVSAYSIDTGGGGDNESAKDAPRILGASEISALSLVRAEMSSAQLLQRAGQFFANVSAQSLQRAGSDSEQSSAQSLQRAEDWTFGVSALSLQRAEISSAQLLQRAEPDSAPSSAQSLQRAEASSALSLQRAETGTPVAPSSSIIIKDDDAEEEGAATADPRIAQLLRARKVNPKVRAELLAMNLPYVRVLAAHLETKDSQHPRATGLFVELIRDDGAHDQFVAAAQAEIERDRLASDPQIARLQSLDREKLKSLVTAAVAGSRDPATLERWRGNWTSFWTMPDLVAALIAQLDGQQGGER